MKLSFGIELETIFCFREDALRRHLRQYCPGSDIVKSYGDNEPYLRHKSYPQRPYNSWAIRDSKAHPETTAPNVTDGANGTYRAYMDEPANMVRDLVWQNPDLAEPATHWRHYEKPTDYSGWSICNDPSLAGISKDEMAEKLPHLVSSAEHAKDWDSWGIELVSPPHTDIQTAMAETSAMIDTITTAASSDYGAITSDLCALHVHVGRPDNTPFDVKTLQHLAWLLVVFEDVISTLHTPGKRQIYSPKPGETMCEIKSNRDYWLLDSPVPAQRSVVDTSTGQPRSETWDLYYSPLDAVKHDIFDSVSAKHDAGAQLARLVQLMSTNQRGHVVNFTGLLQPGRPRTLEFRQHAGTLDARAVRHWVAFCLAAVRAARRRAEAGEPYAVKDWDAVGGLTLEDLFQELRLEEGEREVFADKARGYGPLGETLVFAPALAEDELPGIEDEV